MNLLKNCTPLLFLSALSGSASAQAWIDAPRMLVEANQDIRGIADADGDGDEDLFVVQRLTTNSLAFHVLFRDALGEYGAGAPTTATAPGGGQGDFMQGDLTGDGLPEVLLYVSAGIYEGMHVYRNLGGTFDQSVFVPVENSLRSLVMADRDGDGVLDLGVLELVGWEIPDLVRWWSWNGTTLVPSAAVSPTVNTNWLVAVDLTGEGRSDLVAGDNYSSMIHVSETLAGGEPGSFAELATVGAPDYGFEAYGGDLDGDGDEDLLALWNTFGDQFRRDLAVIDNLGGGALAAGPEQEFELQPAGEFLGKGFLSDWDLDGDLDFLTSWTRLRRLENKGRGRFVLADSVPMPSQSYGAGAADLNADGFPDFAGGRVVLYGDGSLGKQPDEPIRGGLSRIIDLEGDGDLDVLNTEEDSWINDGTGEFRFRDRSAAPPAGSIFVDYTALGDFDSDGRPDFLVERREDEYPFFPFQDTRLLRGSITGDFVDGGPAAAPGVHVGLYWTFDMPPGDADGDSDLDVLTVDGWWENDGTGFFTSFHAAWSGRPSAAADVDADLDLDLLTLTESGATTTLWLQRNQSGGAFAAELLTTESVAGTLSSKSYLADVDQDGDPEVAIGTSASTPRVLVFDNLGGSFGDPLQLPGQDFAQDVLAFSDVDGDGQRDIIGAPYGINGHVGGTWLVWRRAAVTFDPPRAYFSPSADLSCDIDQDGDVDVIGYRTVHNQLFHGRADGLLRQYGRGSRGSGNARPVLGALGPLRPGSPTAALRISRGRGGSMAVVRAGTGPANLGLAPSPGLMFHIRGMLPMSLSVQLGGIPGTPGAGSAELSLTSLTTSLAGLELWMQAFVADPGSTAGVSATNGLAVVFGL